MTPTKSTTISQISFFIATTANTHCKIGKVTRKYVAPAGLIPRGVILPALNDYFTWNPGQSGGYVPNTSSADVPLVPSHGVLL